MTTGRPRLRELALGSIRPRGWLLDQLRLQADGQTGRLEDIWPDVGPDSGWLGGSGESWERGPYYLDGLVPLAHLLQDGELLAKSQKWVEAILAGQQEDGQFGPRANDDWWPRMVALKALVQHSEATDDERVVPFLQRYFRYQAATLPDRPLRDWGRVRGAENLLAVLWLRDRTGEEWLTDLAQTLLSQTADWNDFLTRGLQPGVSQVFDHLTHGVNVAMGLKTTALGHLVEDDPGAEAATWAQLANLDRLHGQVHGVFSSDEWLAGREASRGVETCLVVELMFTLEQLARVFGDGRYCDLLELVAYNLLPASSDARMRAHQYHQQANQVKVSVDRRDWSYSGDDANVFGLEPHFGCCTANLHQGWPKFARSLWMQAADGGLTALAYAPCTVTAAVGAATVHLDVRTDYPFKETVTIEVGVDAPVSFPLRLHVPAWTSRAELHVNDEPVPVRIDAQGFTEVERTWQAGDVLTLTLPMRVRTVARDAGAIGVRLGPLVLAMSPGEVWWPVPGAAGLGEWMVTARSSWNIGLQVDETSSDAWHVDRSGVHEVPFSVDHPPVSVRATGAQVRDWTMQLASSGPVPSGPIETSSPLQDVTLIPYGSARIRITEFPVVRPQVTPHQQP